MHSGTFSMHSGTFLMHSETFWNTLYLFCNILEHSVTFCIHSGTFRNILPAFFNIQDHSACILENSGKFCMHSVTFWNILNSEFRAMPWRGLFNEEKKCQGKINYSISLQELFILLHFLGPLRPLVVALKHCHALSEGDNLSTSVALKIDFLIGKVYHQCNLM